MVVFGSAIAGARLARMWNFHLVLRSGQSALAMKAQSCTRS
jgi:hypothetical protein